ncbi:zinc-dependent metalloprotease [Christiangramia salexigens]|uniref:Peptidase n=1 Tax=Christiangramia salexigens TaxID=1913577 RepID=A0A1L3J2T0_9FLAO|nr:zinc-dependent metalloprotease [Christiangramia salexigens]APG59442.1 peptidase [Christiangramia salexigens]
MYKISCIILAFSISIVANAQFLDKKENLKTYEGYFNFHYNSAEDEIYLEVDKLDSEFLYTHFLTTGVGSNDIGLDRGQLGGTKVVKFKKAGNKLLLMQPNQDYRAITENSAEKQSVAEAFASSVIFGFEIKEQKEGKYIIDLTPFLLQDSHGVADRLKKGKFGSYKLDKSKSALALERTKAFPENVEFEALLTFEGDAQGRTVNSVVPDSKNISLTQHHSFVKLPDDKYEKRIFDPRSGAIFISYMDYASPVYEPIKKRYAIRHRLKKKDPNAEVSEPVEPIIYYLDPGTPEPVRSALLEGASWWNEAYEEIGYKDAFQVKILPEDVDPLDVRYNVIQWVHRSTRGWSYGASVVDPRTGEIIKGHVSLGSLRIRQDFLIAQAMLKDPFRSNDTDHDQMMELALARIRQLSAHEVGHTLGFTHNFAASTNQRASVMDYPHPQFEFNNGEIGIANAYDTGIGEWDKVTVKYSYSDVPENMSEREYLNSVLDKARLEGLRFISDSDARPAGGAHAYAHLWDNGKDAATELDRVLKIRKKAIENFSKDNIRTNEPYSVLEDVFVPLYFFHRYQTEAAIKLIGGLDYNYAVKGDQNQIVNHVPGDLQKKALDKILRTLNAEEMAIPANKLELFPPRAYGFSRDRESFKSNTNVAFDALGAPATAGELTMALLLDPARAERLVQQNALNMNLPGLDMVLERLIQQTIKNEQKDDYLRSVQSTINFVVFEHLLNLAINEKSTPLVRSVANRKIDELAGWLRTKKDAFSTEMYRKIKRFRDKPEEFKIRTNVPKIPDGSPIGTY